MNSKVHHKLEQKNLRKLLKLQRMVETVKKAMDDHKEYLCENDCPAKKGDIIPITGYSYENKLMEVIRVSLVEGWKERTFYYKIWGRVLRKDGTTGKHVTSTEIHIQ